MATQLAKMASRMKISKGLRGAVKGTVSSKQVTHVHQSQDRLETHTHTKTVRRIFPLHQGQRGHADGVAEGEAAEGSGGPEGRLVRLHRLLGPPTPFSGGASRPKGV